MCFYSLQDARGHTNLGAILHLNGKYREAANSYREALRLQPDDVTTLTNLHKLRTVMTWHSGRLGDRPSSTDEPKNLWTRVHRVTVPWRRPRCKLPLAPTRWPPLRFLSTNISVCCMCFNAPKPASMGPCTLGRLWWQYLDDYGDIFYCCKDDVSFQSNREWYYCTYYLIGEHNVYFTGGGTSSAFCADRWSF